MVIPPGPRSGQSLPSDPSDLPGDHDELDEPEEMEPVESREQRDEPAWSPGDPEAWGGEEGAQEAWQPESPDTWQKVNETIRGKPEPVAVPAPIRRSDHHRDLIRRSKPKFKRYRDPLSNMSRKSRRFREKYGYGWRRRRRRRLLRWSLVLFGLLLVGGAATAADAYYQTYKIYQDVKGIDRKSTRLNSSHIQKSRMPSSA